MTNLERIKHFISVALDNDTMSAKEFTIAKTSANVLLGIVMVLTTCLNLTLALLQFTACLLQTGYVLSVKALNRITPKPATEESQE